jgi:molybdenum cofactor biosynthesis protein B
MSETTAKHKEEAPGTVKAAVLTVSDSKSNNAEKEKDTSGQYISDALKGAGHDVVSYKIVPDDEASIIEAIDYIIENRAPDAIITTGGTGISKRDVTIEAVSGMLEKVLEGFGELFRSKSGERIGTAVVASRALAGVSNGTVIFSLPGSPDAVRTGMDIILKEIAHIVKHARE